ncbi:hypothetical protein JCM5353_001420 [Sporobolomyces roseus]
MFFSQQLLVGKKGGFAVVWLAASIGVKGSAGVKKLSKKELLACDLVKACEQVAAPAEPLALRLSSNLLSGIARVYQQQFLFFSSDVTQFHQALRKALSDALIASTDITAKIDLVPSHKAGAAAKAGDKGIAAPPALTLVKNQALALYGYNPDDGIDDGNWYLPGTEPRAMTPEFEIEGIVPSVEGTPERGDSPFRQPTGAYQARAADITLEEPHIQDYAYEGGFEAGLGGDFGTGEQLELGIFGEGERGILEGQSPELDAVLRAASSGGRTGPAPSTSGVQHDDYGDFFAGKEYGGDMDMGGMEDQPVDYGDMLGAIEGESLEARVAREHAEGFAAREGAFAGRQASSPAGRVEGGLPFDQELSQTPSSGTKRRISDALEQVQEVKQVAKRQKKSKRISIDRTTELTDDAFRTSRATYNERMAVERKKMEKVQEEKEAHKTAMELIFGPPLLFQGPALSKFWNESLAVQMTPFDGGKAVEAKKRLGKNGKKEPSPSPFLAVPAGQRPVEMGRGRGAVSPASLKGIGGQFDEGDFFAGRDYGGDMRQEGDADLGGMEPQFFQDEMELGRARSPSAGALASSFGTRPSFTPWAGESGTAGASDQGRADLGGRRRSSPAGADQEGRISLDQPDLPGMRRFSRTPSLQPPSIGDRASRQGSFGLEGFGEIQPEYGGDMEEVGRVSRASSLVASPRPSDLAQTLEQESLKFYQYILRISSSLPAPTPPKKKLVTFSGLVPVKEMTASTAAQALYHTLSLGMKGVFRSIRQEEAYGEIEIELKE